MSNRLIVLIILCLFNLSSIAQIPLKKIKKEVKSLKTEEKIEAYWESIHMIDQKVLLRINNKREYDSLSICNMIKTYYLWQFYKEKGFNNYNNVVPVLNLSHGLIGEANVVYWPILDYYYIIGEGISTIGGKNYSYPLECVSLTFYNYSVLKEEQLYPELLQKLKITGQVYRPIPDRLNRIFIEQNRIRELKEIESIGSWQMQPFPDMKQDFCFEFVKMSDDNVYIKQGNIANENHRYKKMKLVKENDNLKNYQIYAEPFGWTYTLSGNDLKLINENGEILIEYSYCH